MVTREDVKRLAALSMLDLTDEQLDRLTKDMQSIVRFADTINAAEAKDRDNTGINNIFNAYREDIVKPSFEQSEILSNVDGGEDGFFAVSSRKM